MSRFSLVGAFNTIGNLILFNIFIYLGQSAVVANLTSLSVSIVGSFLLNAKYVFFSTENNKKKFIMFFIGTIFIQIAVQHFSIVVAGEHASIIMGGLEAINSQFSTLSEGTRALVVENIGKFIGVVFSVILSYVFYDRVVFRRS